MWGVIITDIFVREANFDDYEWIKNLVKQVHMIHVMNRPDVYVDVYDPFTRSQFYEILNDDKSKVFVATINGNIVAYSIFEIMQTRNISILKQKRFIYIDDICVDSDYRKHGISRKLFNKIVDYAKINDINSIQLTVWEFNNDAIKFYEDLGMTTRNRKMEIEIL